MGLNKAVGMALNGLVDSKKILKDLEAKPKKQPVSFRIDPAIWKRFKAAIGKNSQNKVIERIMLEFLKNLESKD